MLTKSWMIGLMLWKNFYAEKPWWDYHERFAKPLGKIVVR
jgi:kynureninase